MTDPIDDKIKLLHTAVSHKYDVGTLEEFAQKLQDPTKRKAFYDGVGKEYELGDYADFETKVKKKDDTFSFSLPGTIDLSKDAEQLSISSPNLGPEQQALTEQIPEPQSSGITINPTKEQDKAFQEAINAPQKSFEQVGIDYEKQKKSEQGAKDYVTGAENKENDPFITFGKSVWNTLAYQLPSAIGGAMATMAENHDSFSNPSMNTKEKEEDIKRTKANMIKWAVKHGAKGEEMTKDLVSTMDKIKDPIDALNWFSYAMGQAAGQIPASVATGGATSIGQEVGSIYLDGVKKIAQDHNLSIEQVIDQKLDHPAIAVAFGTASGLLDYIGAKTVLKVPKQSLISSLRKRATDLIKTGGTEAGTEYSQTWIEQIGKGQVAGNDLGKSWEEANTSEAARERLESAAQGFVGGAGSHIVSNKMAVKKIDEKPIEQSGEISGQNIPEVKQEESVPVQTTQEEQKTETIKPKENAISERKSETLSLDETSRHSEKVGTRIPESGEVAQENRTEEEKQPSQVGDNSKEEIINKINSLNENESEGYNIVRLREAKEDMLNDPKRAEVAFKIMDFAGRVWGMEKDFEKHPLTHISQFFYGDANSLKEFVDEQINGEEQSIKTDEEYLKSLNPKKKSDQKSIKFTEDKIQSAKERITRYQTEYQNENPKTTNQGSEVLHPESNKEVKADAIKEANDIAKEHGFDSASHLLNSVSKRTGQEYKNVQEVPEKVIEQIKSEKVDEIERDKKIKSKLKEEGYGASDIEAEGEERQKIAKEIHEETGKYLLNREGVLVDDNGSFADRTSDTFFDLIDENKSVYLLSPDAKIAETKDDYKLINEKLESKVPVIAGSMSFDDAFSSGAVDAAKALGYDAIRLTEIDGTNGTLHILNFDKLEHVTGKDVVKEKGQKLSKESEHKKGDQVDFIAPSGQSKTGTIEGFNEEKGKYKIRATNGTVWNVDPKSINVYEGEQASTKKFYEPPVGAPRKNKGKFQRISVSPVYGADPKMLKQIIIDLSKSIASKIYYAKRVAGRRRALGTYSPANAAIHIKFQGDLDTTAHELGHSIDDIFDLLGKSNPAMEKELNELSKFGSKPKKGHPNPKDYKLGEGLAEYIRALLVNPQETQTKYPETTKVFESTVPKEMMDKLRAFGDDIRKYAGLSGHNKIMSNVQFEPEENKSWFTKFIKNKSKENFELTWLDRLGQQWTNTLIPFEKAVKFLLDKQGTTEVQPSQDPIILARLLAGENSKIQDIIENGFIDPENPIDSSDPKNVKLNRLIDPVSGEAMNFEWLITPLDNSTEKSIKEEQKKVISYMVAKRTLEMSKKLGREDFLTGIGAGVFQDVTVAKERLAEHDNENKETKDRIEEAARRYQAYANAGLEVAVANGRLSKESLKIIKDANLEYVALNRIAEASPDEEVVSFNKSGNNAIGTTSEIIKKQKGSTKTIQNPYQSLIENTSKVIRESDRNNVLLAFKELAVAARKMHEGEPKYLGSVATQVGGTGDNTITIFDNGQKEYWKFDGDVYKALKNITENIKLSPWITALPRLLRSGIINFPVFAVKNRIRDIQSRFVLSKEAYTGLDINFKKGRKKATLDAYNNAGGGQAGYYLMNEEFYYHEMDKITHELAKDKNNILTTPDKMLKNAGDWYHNLIASGETATRLEEYRSAFKQAKAKGLDDYNAMVYAAFKARDLMDFAVAGEQMKWINQIIPFSNAAIQGLRKHITTAKNDPVGFSLRFMLYMVLPTLFLRMLAHSLGRDKEYAELPDYRRDLFYNIPVGNNLWLTIPKSFEVGVMSSGVERMFSKAFYGDKKAMEGYAGSVARSVSPIDESALVGPGRSAVEVLANYDFFRNQHIIPTEEENLDMRLRKTESASRLGKAISSVVSVDPRYLDYLVKSNTGYFGDLALRLSDIGKDDSRHPIDFTATGLFRNDPVYDSKSVQHLMNEVKRLGIKNNDSFLQLFNLVLSDYFDQKDPKLKSEAGETVRQTAEFITKIWEGINLEEMTLMKHDIKQSVRK